MKGGVLVDAKDNAYLEYLEAQFEDERREETEKTARLARGRSRVDMSANSPQKEWVFWLCWSFYGPGLSSLLVIGIGWMLNTGMRGPFLK